MSSITGSKVSQLIIPSRGKILLYRGSGLCIWSYPLQDSNTSIVVVYVIIGMTNVIIDVDAVLNLFTQEVFFKIACK